uniref:UDP-glycosyltransferases domain-containing protein n=1 Tax=Chromera velia CCMP2878 TaxID=1169474 RepID=A0A0G4I5N5_9ALVE|eukprot:Cvel_11217.t1-p1 / transcript=Cvel_11217.t1 / gene=Cvel_11217 / organism=Chromera_velia_CCMP2878 / gene_product=Uncharacterized UDP-glucosyltransferase YojK, putative / transcript_product=Uncharacterized UDP-glucosyltransferase YojK, putative / location=Cvel_scaffold698:3362-4774(-) / protein_length=471 / sequence_SO=supercontig / SO=protein_coding / is_pseudo=false
MKGKGTVVMFTAEHVGHLNPTLAVVELLVQSGYRVVYFAPEGMKGKVEKAGAVFEAYAEGWNMTQAAVSLVKSLGLEPTEEQKGQRLPECAVPAAVSLLRDGLVDRVKKLGDVRFIFSDSSYPWGPLVASLLGLPFLSSCSSTPMTDEVVEPLFGYLRSNESLRRCAEVLKKEFSITYDPARTYTNYSDFTVVYTLEEFHPEIREGFQSRVKFFGVSLDEQERKVARMSLGEVRTEMEKEDAELSDFVNMRKRDDHILVYVSLGTILGHEKWTLDPLPFFRMLFELLGGDDQYRVVLSVGARTEFESLGDIPENFCVRRSVQQKTVLRLVDLFVTHCGNNSVHESIVAGCPMVCLPFFGDQSMNADLVLRHGLGVCIPSPHAPAPARSVAHVTRERFSEALDELTTPGKCSAVKKASAQMRSHALKQLDWLEKEAVTEMEQFLLLQDASLTESLNGRCGPRSQTRNLTIPN